MDRTGLVFKQQYRRYVMRARGWIVQGMVGCLVLVSASGCMSMNEHRRVQARNRMLAAEKEAMAQELADARSANDTLRMRIDSHNQELSTKSELIANLRSENEVLDEMRRLAQTHLEGMAGRQGLGDITIAGQVLPEKLDTALKHFAQQHPQAVTYDGSRGTIKWKSDLLFALGSDVVKESSMTALRGFADIIKSEAANDFEVIVVGHTDNTPIGKPQTKQRHPSNWHLSAHRAISVATILQRAGYGAERIGVMGFGEYRPMADNATAQGKSQNRRVEIYLRPRGSIGHAAVSFEGVHPGDALASAPNQP